MNLSRDHFVRGRCVEVQANFLVIENTHGKKRIFYNPKRNCLFQVGDIVQAKLSGQVRVSGNQEPNSELFGEISVLTPNRSPLRSNHWMRRVLDPRRAHAQRVRSHIEAGIRDFFSARQFQETRTPMLVPCPGMETHIRPFRVVEGGYLPTSPEFAMKRLLVGGLEKIFQICPAFRYEPKSPQHHPEFTLLEWYRAYANLDQIMCDMEELLERLAMGIHGEPYTKYQGRKISLKTPWPRLRVRDLFQVHLGIDLVQCQSLESMRLQVRRVGLTVSEKETWDDLYFKLWLNYIEPRLPEDQAVFVTHYPASQSALAVLEKDSDGSLWAKRFEPYAGGLELGNAFEELTDPVEQRIRFIHDMNLRESLYGADFPRNPIDEDFLEALNEGMPPSGGIAVGVDRLVMLLANEPNIDYTIWLPSYFNPASQL